MYTAGGNILGFIVSQATRLPRILYLTCPKIYEINIQSISFKMTRQCTELIIHGLMWVNPSDKFKTPYFLYLREMRLSLNFYNVLKSWQSGTREYYINRLQVNGFDLHTEKADDGEINYISAIGASTSHEVNPSRGEFVLSLLKRYAPSWMEHIRNDKKNSKIQLRRLELNRISMHFYDVKECIRIESLDRVLCDPNGEIPTYYELLESIVKLIAEQPGVQGPFVRHIHEQEAKEKFLRHIYEAKEKRSCSIC